MNFKYVPVLRNRQAEIEAISNQNFSDNIIPLIEIVVEKPRSNSRGDIIDNYKDFFLKFKNPVIVDIPMNLLLPSNTKKSVLNFLMPIYNNPIERLNLLNQFSKISKSKIIPTISYNPKTPYSKGFIRIQSEEFKKTFSHVAYRIFSKASDDILDDIKDIIGTNDILILDIGEIAHTQNSLKGLYDKLNAIKDSTNCKTVIIKSALPDSLKNTELIDGETIDIADNSIIDFYIKYGFNAFGDYAGIKSSEILDIPAASPAHITFENKENVYAGFKGVYKQTSTYETMILPKYINSFYWTTLSDEHKQNCYGCYLIQEMLKGKLSPNTPVKWKTVAISHYIRSVDELL